MTGVRTGIVENQSNQIVMDKCRRPSVLLIAATAVLCMGCSIKEDRSLCPCALVLDFSGVAENVAEFAEVYISAADGFLYSDTEAYANICSDETAGSVRRIYNAKVPKTSLSLSVVSGDGHFYSQGRGISIPLGEECPPVYMHYSEMNAAMEKYDETVRMYKDYCRITVRMLSASGDYPFSLTVKGNICGYSPDRSVVEGDFSFTFVPASDGTGSVRVPRQTDDSLILQIRDGNRVLREFALGEYVAESGYDWEAENLSDVEIAIDYANSNITVKVEGWSDIFEYDVVI